MKTPGMLALDKLRGFLKVPEHRLKGTFDVIEAELLRGHNAIWRECAVCLNTGIATHMDGSPVSPCPACGRQSTMRTPILDPS